MAYADLNHATVSLVTPPGKSTWAGLDVKPKASPLIGQWYRHLDKGESFLVTAHDERTGSTEIQFFDGDLDEIDADAWAELPVVLAEPPEDWTGPVDSAPHDDLGYSETAMKENDWEAPLQAL